MIGTYVSAILICVVALVIGRGICILVGLEGRSWLAAPVGFAALMAICNVAIDLPGRGWTAVAAVVIFVAVSVWIGVTRGAPWPSRADGLAVAAGVLLITAVPFLANGRVGVLGISFLNDTHWHLFLAQGLLQPSIRSLDAYGVGYPLGPHAVSATFAQMLGSSVDKTLTGVLIATPVLTGLAALGAIGDLPRARRWLVAILAAVPYLAVAWYVQSAFKEPIMSLLLVGMVLALQAGHQARFSRPEAVVVPLAVLTAGVLYDYSYPGLVWPAAVLACWAVLELGFSGAWRRVGSLARGLGAAVPAFGLAAGLLALLVIPDVNRIYMFWQDNGGTGVGTTGGVVAASLANLTGPLAPRRRRSTSGSGVTFGWFPRCAARGGAGRVWGAAGAVRNRPRPGPARAGLGWLGGGHGAGIRLHQVLAVPIRGSQGPGDSWPVAGAGRRGGADA